MNELSVIENDNRRSATIRERINNIRAAVDIEEVQNAAEQYPECREVLERLHHKLKVLEVQLSKAPPIDVAMLGPSRHGKSIAWVGFGNHGGGDLNACSNGNNVVALADCDPNVWGKRKAKLLKGICFLPAPPPVTIGPGMEGVHSICHKNSSFERGYNNILIHSSMGIAFKVVG